MAEVKTLPFIPKRAVPVILFWIKLVVGLILGALLIYGATRAYAHWQTGRLTRNATAFLEKKEYINAALSAQRALELNPNNLAAMRLMAELTEAVGSPESLYWRQGVIRLNPSSLDDQYALVATAVQFGQTDLAKKTLDEAAAKGANTAAFEAQSGTLALALGQRDEAAKHFGKAVELEPKTELYQYSYATLMLGSEQNQAATETLRKLTTSKQVGTLASRALVLVAISRSDFKAALAYSLTLLNQSQASFSDRIIHLYLLQRTQSTNFPGFLKSTEAIAQDSPASTSSLIVWMNGAGLVAEAQRWATSLPQKTKMNAQVGVALADSYITTKDWKALKELVATADWNELNYLKFAYYSRAYKELGESEVARKAQWESAIGAAAQYPGQLRSLAQLAVSWGWKDESESVFWKARSSLADAEWSLASLYQFYQEKRDTRGLLRISRLLCDRKPKDPALHNNLNTFSLLLNEDADQALASAKALAEKNPGNPTLASTYALGLYLQKQPAKALAVMKALKPEQLALPSVAGYYAIILVSNGDFSRARTYSALARGTSFLPEEEVLLADALGKIPPVIPSGR